jgi:C-terminal processing protease CtpA/Prc
MVGKKLGLLFLLAVVLSFLTGYFAKEIMPAFFSGKPSESFDFLTDYLGENYYYELDSQKIDQAYIDSLYAIVESYARQHNDPYTRLFQVPQTNTSYFDEYYIGMGIEVAQDQNRILVLEVNPQSDAFGRLLPGDYIVGVENQGNDIYFDELDDMSDMFSYLSPGSDTQKTVIVLTRDAIEEKMTIQLKTILTPSVVVKNLNESHIAYLHINSFNAYADDTSNPGTRYLFKQALAEL